MIRSVLLVALLLSVSLGAKFRPRDAVDPYPISHWDHLLLIEEQHSQAQKLGFGQRPSTWTEYHAAFCNHHLGKLRNWETIRLDRKPVIYKRDGLYRFYAPANGRWGETTIYIFKELHHKRSTITHEPQF